MAAQLMAMKAPLRRADSAWMARAKSSLPVPLSPSSSTVASLALPAVLRGAFAQDVWPSREIHSICGFPPGSGADVFVRYYNRRLEGALGGKTIITENKVGAFGNIARFRGGQEDVIPVVWHGESSRVQSSSKAEL